MLPSNAEHRPLRVVLIDFDWEDADLLPELLRKPGVHIRLVAGEKQAEAGFRVAELCGVPRSVDLADLTREIFDLALVGERSPRRAQIERLLNALGTPVASPHGFLTEVPPTNGHRGDRGANGGHETAGALDALLAKALPDLSSPARDVPGNVAPQVASQTVSTLERADLGSIAPRANQNEVQHMLGRWMITTGGLAAVLYLHRSGEVREPSATGEHDALVDALAKIACSTRSEQLVSMLAGRHRGKLWGAWPLAIGEEVGALAVAGIERSEGRGFWEMAAAALNEAWNDRRDAQRAGATPSGHITLTPDTFLAELERAVDRNRQDGERFTLHRLRLNGPQACVEAFMQMLPDQLRSSDSLCHPFPGQVVMVCAGPVGSFAFVRRRLMGVWEQAWRAAGPPAPPPPIVDERVELVDPPDAAGFLGIAGEWLTGD